MGVEFLVLIRPAKGKRGGEREREESDVLCPWHESGALHLVGAQ